MKLVSRGVSVLLVAAAFVAISVAAIGEAQRPVAGADYLDPNLRADVERLKIEGAEATGDLEILGRRIDTLWRWGNALAVHTEWALPPDFPYFWIMAAVSLRNVDAVPQDSLMSHDQLAEFVARYTREFQIREEMPGAIGTLAYSERGPFEAGQYVTLELTYTVGEMPMVAGGGILMPNGWYSAVGTRVQNDDPDGDGFVTIRSSSPSARFAPAEPWGSWYQWHNTRPDACFRLEEGALGPGDTITVTIGDRSRGSAGLKLQNWANDDVLLRLYVDLEGTGFMLAPRWPAFQVVGRPEVRFVNAVARPAVVRPGESFELAVRSEDRFKNPTSGTTPAYEILLDGEPYRALPTGRQALTVLGGLKLDRPGTYRFEVRSQDGTMQGVSNPVWVQEIAGPRIFFGDTHGHTSWADAQGTPEGFYRYARDVSRLDFVTLSEHDLWTDDWEWRALRELPGRFLEPGRFSTFLSYEWTSSIEVGGHHNVYFRSPEGRERVSIHQATRLDQLYEGLAARYDPRDVLIIPHAHSPGDWRKNEPDMERVVEITSKHGTFEWFGNKFLENGFQMGFIGSSDNHTQRPGYVGATAQMSGLAAVLAAENTPEALFEALRDRGCYATTGERILVDASLNGARMGQRLPEADRRTVRCRISGTEPIAAVDLIKNGRVIYTMRARQPQLRSDVEVQVQLESSSAVFEGYLPPRTEREWRGAIEVRGARLAAFEKPWFHNPVVGSFEIDADPENSDRVLFHFSTRGRPKGVLLRLVEAGPDTEIVVTTQPARQASSTGIPGEDLTRPSSELPAVALVARLGRLLEGPAIEEQRIGRHIDRAVIELVPDDEALDQEFSYTDLDDPQRGDYYYVRVRQVDGSMAWSSPWWVGKRAVE